MCVVMRDVIVPVARCARPPAAVLNVIMCCAVAVRAVQIDNLQLEYSVEYLEYSTASRY